MATPEWAAELPDWLRKMRPGDPIQVTIVGRLEDVCKGSLFRRGGGVPHEMEGLIMTVAFGADGQLDLLVGGETGVTVTTFAPVAAGRA